MSEETNTLIVFCTIAIMVVIAVAAYFIWNSIHPETCVSEIRKLDIDGFASMERPAEIICDNSVTMNNGVPFFLPITTFLFEGKGECYYKIVECTRK